MTTVWSHTPWLVKIGAATGAVGMAGLYSSPIILWGAGAAEGTVRAVGHSALTALSIAVLQRKWAQHQWEEAKSNGRIACGCGILAGLSCIPLIGTGYGIAYFVDEVGKYNRAKTAVARAQKRAGEEECSQLTAPMLQGELSEQRLQDLFSKAQRIEQCRPRVYQEDFTTGDRELKGTLIHRNYLYTAGYYSVKGVGDAINGILSNGYVKRAFKYVWHRSVDGVRFTANTVADELFYTLDLCQQPKSEQWQDFVAGKHWRWER
ncbi:MAG: hypothetical protein KDK78_00715 [Chlamydiia bacterium]|nr:hypothetical protein [Chlamydiia bacterium]